MHDDVARIIAETRRLAWDFPEERTPRLTVAELLRLSAPERRALALTARGYRPDQIAQLSATTLVVARRRVGRAVEKTGVGPRFGQVPRS